MIEYLKIAFYLSLVFSLIAMGYQIFRTWRFGRKPMQAQPQGSRIRGIVYAFTKGMAPWEKESAGKHLPTYLTGILYHLGIFAAIIYLFLALWQIPIPVFILNSFRILIGLAITGGIGLLIKRIFKSTLRFISCADDFISNILVGTFLLLTLIHTFSAKTLPFLLLITILLVLYIPLGKIRHCFFFFYARILFGSYFGLRGVFPHKAPK